jgi:hypothetical protein
MEKPMTDDLETASRRSDYPEMIRNALCDFIEERVRFHDWRQSSPSDKEQTALQSFAAEGENDTLVELAGYSPKPLGQRDRAAEDIARAIRLRIDDLRKRRAKAGG